MHVPPNSSAGIRSISLGSIPSLGHVEGNDPHHGGCGSAGWDMVIANLQKEAGGVADFQWLKEQKR
ncbi:hypothetical protein NicSoilB8_29270 [Arthrobacter sp. NicSoilB8]|nr:hypothetical protein NicSoilB8_29270 [Arthrobacter sp. NicSoilB8]